MVKLVDVARAVGVSVATVSRTLNGNDRVTPSSPPGCTARSASWTTARSHGWRRPACISGPIDAETAVQRAEAFRSVVRRHGLVELVSHVPYDAPGGSLAAESLPSGPVPPDCLVVASSVLAIGALETIRRLGPRPRRSSSPPA